MFRLISILSIVLCVSACSGLGKKEMSVWDIYDVRHPVPAGSAVPVSRATSYEQYQDNDAYYTPPAYGTCSASDPTMSGCE